MTQSGCGDTYYYHADWFFNCFTILTRLHPAKKTTFKKTCSSFVYASGTDKAMWIAYGSISDESLRSIKNCGTAFQPWAKARDGPATCHGDVSLRRQKDLDQIPCGQLVQVLVLRRKQRTCGHLVAMGQNLWNTMKYQMYPIRVGRWTLLHTFTSYFNAKSTRVLREKRHLAIAPVDDPRIWELLFTLPILSHLKDLFTSWASCWRPGDMGMDQVIEYPEYPNNMMFIQFYTYTAYTVIYCICTLEATIFSASILVVP